MNIKLLYQIIKNPISELLDIGYGADAAKDTAPHVWQVYLAIDTKCIYYCIVDGTWICYNELDIVTTPLRYTMPGVDGDPGQVLKTDGNGDLYWADPGEGLIPSSTIEKYNKITGVSHSSLMTIVSLTNTGFNSWLTGCIANGNLTAKYTIYINGVEKGTVKSSHQDRNGKVILPQPIRVLDGQIIDVKVIHSNTSETGEFEATIYTHKY